MRLGTQNCNCGSKLGISSPKCSFGNKIFGQEETLPTATASSLSEICGCLLEDCNLLPLAFLSHDAAARDKRALYIEDFLEICRLLLLLMPSDRFTPVIANGRPSEVQVRQRKPIDSASGAARIWSQGGHSNSTFYPSPSLSFLPFTSSPLFLPSVPLEVGPFKYS